MEDTNYVLYAHYTLDTNELFYIGEGRPDRAKRKNHRNRWWNFKAKKHGGFKVVILASNLTKQQAEDLEEGVIKKCKELGFNLVNLANGPLYRNHWLAGAPKEIHPQFGKRFKAPWIVESNKRRTGQKLKPRPDLIERNKLGNFKRKSTPVLCVELNKKFDSMKDAADFVKGNSGKISRSCTDGRRHKGYHWRRL